MDKYEFNIKVDQIKKLSARKAYKEAAEIAKSMNWQKVKDWSVLAVVINVQEAAGDLLEARDMAILAYNRNLGGRKLVYKLTELLIKLEDFENAEELYDEYERMAQHDVNRFILYYELRKAQKASDNELVEILEDYREHEIDEKYMYELAKLYFNTGRREECIKICDDLVLWFQDGIYVESAIELKQQYGVALTKIQQKILENAKKRKEDAELTKEELFKQQQELVRIQHDDVDEELRRDELDDDEEEGGIKGFFKKAFSGLQIDRDDDEDDETEDSSEDYDISIVDSEPDEALHIDIPNASASASENEEENSKDLDNLNKASISLKELIQSAKKQVEENCEQMSRDVDLTASDKPEESTEDEQQEEKNDISQESGDDTPVIIAEDYQNLYNTQDIQKELVKNLTKFMEEEEAEVAALRPQPIAAEDDEVNAENEQIEGQLSLADWVETVREEKYGKQNTREFSKAELERMLDEKDEKSAAYEKIMAEQKALAQAAGTEFDEAEARRKAHAQMIINAAKTDLAIRTGKASAKLEVEADKKKAQQKAAKEAALKALEAERKAKEEAERKAQQEEQAKAEEKEASEEDVKTLEQPEIKEEIVESAEDTEVKDEAQAENQAVNVDTPSVGKFTKKSEESVVSNIDELENDLDDDRKLSPELSKIFRKYKEMPGLESQLVKYFDALEKEMQMNTSEVGNIIISGNSSSDKTDLARTIVRAINYLYPDNQKKIAKTTGDSINHRGLTKAMNKLKGTALIVEGAGVIQPKRVGEVLECLKQDTERMIVIFEDSDAEMNVLINFNPEVLDTFNHRITLKQYTVNELVEMARKYARKRQYEVDDDALLELYLKIDKLHTINDNIKLDDIKEVINRAIENSERRASKKLFGGLKKKRGNSGNVIFLSEDDFKD